MLWQVSTHPLGPETCQLLRPKGSLIMSYDELAIRVRAEFAEIPGLRLTLWQASKLWHSDQVTCESVLERLVREQFLSRTLDGAFEKLDRARSRSLNRHSHRPAAA